MVVAAGHTLATRARDLAAVEAGSPVAATGRDVVARAAGRPVAATGRDVVARAAGRDVPEGENRGGGGVAAATRDADIRPTWMMTPKKQTVRFDINK